MPQNDPQGERVRNEHIAIVNKEMIEMNVREYPEFIRDASPYFAPSIANFCVHLSFVLTGNILHGAWIMLMLTPIYNMLWIGGKNNQNIV